MTGTSHFHLLVLLQEPLTELMRRLPHTDEILGRLLRRVHEVTRLRRELIVLDEDGHDTVNGLVHNLTHLFERHAMKK
jgi:hypothetical protein